MQHIIKKQIISLTLNNKMDAFAIQHLVSEHYWQEIVPVLQKALDRASIEEETIYLDKLEIDLGIIKIQDIESGRWNDDVYKKISEQLSLLNAGPSSDKKVKKQSKPLSIAEQWIFYMQHGYLPWNALQHTEEWYKNALEAFAGDSMAISKLRSLIRNNAIAVTRIVFQHSGKFLEALIETLTAENQHTLPELIAEMTQVILFLNQLNENDLVLKKKLVQKLWEQVLQIAATSEKNLSPEKFARFLLVRNISGDLTIESLPRKFLLKKRLTASVLKQIKKEGSEIEKRKQQEFIEDKRVPAEIKTLVDEDGIFIPHAGLVLLQPFLNMFFKNLQLVKENVFVSEVSHQKSLFLLYYMATGLATPGEHELTIEKILCAWPLEKPVGSDMKITVDEFKEADILLTEVIGQWEILKETSLAGLREGFLQRNGKLYTRNDSLHLQVEASSIDVLLDHLPWNLSLVKLPWMKNILRVEWR